MINLECKDWIKNISSYKKSIILDVRTVEEYEEICIPNAILANILEPNEFMDVVEKLEKKSKIFQLISDQKTLLKAHKSKGQKWKI